ncbi:hypothetical protein MMC21_002918 [Puttea exsequens]|nr:hypothetical protein [Puttea exsequens]
MSNPRRDVIDLTRDTSSPLPESHTPPLRRTTTRGANRPPRFDREIINIDGQDGDAAIAREESPEIELLEARTLPRLRSQPPGSSRHTRRTGHNEPTRSPPRHAHASAAPDRHQNQNQVPGWANTLRNIPFGITFNRILHGADQLVTWEDANGGVFDAPEDLNFFMPGFDYENPARPPQNPSEPTYDPPSPAKPGFTRSPNGDDILVCPHCDNELGVGDDERKRQVWIAKACGHVSLSQETRS